MTARIVPMPPIVISNRAIASAKRTARRVLRSRGRPVYAILGSMQAFRNGPATCHRPPGTCAFELVLQSHGCERLRGDFLADRQVARTHDIELPFLAEDV